MKIILSEGINRIYVQSLCMAFFHGIKFPLDDQDNEDGMELIVNLQQNYNSILCNAILKTKSNCVEGSLEYQRSNDENDKREVKTAVGQLVYNLCKQVTGKDIEWGILTGIRPSKVCAELLSKFSEEIVFEILTKRYFLSSDKAKLLLEVTKNEASIMQMINQILRRSQT